MSASPSLARRALLAVGLMIGFYVLALLIAGGLIGIAYAYAAYGKHIQVRVIIFCGIGALTILWSILPRIDRFVPPGPPLKPEDQPRLFAAIKGVAGATQQTMPVDVYLVPDVNAWVAQRGGVMGFFSRRVMGIGLPLLRILTVSQFRAVLAHEFGHYDQGDTRLGPWVYKTRAAIGRTLEGLSESVLQALFLWYGRMFLRISHQVSRQQEFVADRISAQMAGSRVAIDGLKAVHRHAPAFNGYWTSEVLPVLEAGYKPPIADGFAKFINSSAVADQTAALLEKMLSHEDTNPYDTHPALRERITALEKFPPGEIPSDDPPALALLDNVTALETELLGAIADEKIVRQLKDITWDDVATTVHVEEWKRQVTAHAASLAEVEIKDLPNLATDRVALDALFRHPARKSLTSDQRVSIMLSTLGSALCLLLLDNGWTLHVSPGEPIVFRKSDLEFEPFTFLHQLIKRELSAKDWEKKYRETGIADLGFAQLKIEAVEAPASPVPVEKVVCPRCDAELPFIREGSGKMQLTCPNCGKVLLA